MSKKELIAEYISQNNDDTRLVEKIISDMTKPLLEALPPEKAEAFIKELVKASGEAARKVQPDILDEVYTTEQLAALVAFRKECPWSQEKANELLEKSQQKTNKELEGIMPAILEKYLGDLDVEETDGDGAGLSK